MIRLDLDLITARLASLQTGGTVDLVARAATQNAALQRGQRVAKSLWVYRANIDVEQVGPAMREQTETIAVVALLRDVMTAPDTGSDAADTLAAICNAAGALLAPVAGWRPSSSCRHMLWQGGSLILSSDQAAAWEDRYTVVLSTL
jgi:hypothetical protein